MRVWAAALGQRCWREARPTRVFVLYTLATCLLARVSVLSDSVLVLCAADIPASAEEADARLLTAVRKPQVVDIATGAGGLNVTVGAFS